VEIALWAREKLDWLRGYLRLAHGIPSHDTFGRMFGLIDPAQFEAAFRRWVKSVLPALGAEIVAIDGKTSRRSGGVDATALHLVSAFAAGAGLVLGQRATAEKSNEITAIPELLSNLALAGCTVTIDAIGTQTAIAEAIQERGADYVLAVKDNQPRLAESIEDFWRSFRAHPAIHTPHRFAESVEKDHGRIETRRCFVFDQLECLDNPRQWKGLRCFAMIESERALGDKTTCERRLYISSLPPDAHRIAHAVRAHWSVENRLHWTMDVAFNDDQMRARTKAAAHNLAVLKHIALNLIRIDPIKRKGGIKARRLIAATSDIYRTQLLGLA
jgi:predicted transposase YbfD/YdcC